MLIPCVGLCLPASPQVENPLFKRLPESERRQRFFEAYGHKPDLEQANLSDLAELRDIRMSRDVVGCNCHSIVQDIKKFTSERLVHELALRNVRAHACLQLYRTLTLLSYIRLFLGVGIMCSSCFRGAAVTPVCDGGCRCRRTHRVAAGSYKTDCATCV